MSSDQQSYAQLNISIEQSAWDHSFDSNSTECYTHINEAATTDAVKENEIFNDCHIEHTQYSRVESLDATEILKNVLSSEVNEVTENNPSLIIHSPENIERSRHEEDTELKLDKPENENQLSEIVDSTEGFEVPCVADAVLISSRETQEDFGILNDVNGIRSDDVPYDSNAVSSLTTDSEPNRSNIVDSQSGNAIERQETTNLEQRNSFLCKSDEYIQPTIPQTSEDHHTKDDHFNEDKRATSDEKTTSKEREDEKCDKFSEIHETECADQDDGDEIDKIADLSTDETELLSNEPDFDYDSGEYRSIDVVDFDGTDEVENDEYILDTVVQKPRKERRRILMLTNDEDSDADMEVEREQLLKSPMMDENVIDDDAEVEEDVDIELLIKNEKPGPKSKKMSTQKLKELQARALLKNAVVIPSSNSKKRKSRIIDSDDEDVDSSLLPYCVDVDDIGLPDVSLENEESDAVEANSILMHDVDKNDKVAKQEEDGCATSSYENQLYSTENKFKTESPTIMTSQQSQNVDVSRESSDHLKDGTTNFQETTTVKQEPENVVMKMEAISMRDSDDSTDSTNQECLQKEELAGTNFPSFSSSSSSDDEDEFIPNDVYFGTPDVTSKKSGRGKGRPRGRATQSSSRAITIPQNGIKKSEKGRSTGRRARNRFIDNRRISPASDSVSTSSSIETDDEYEKSKAKRKSHTITIVKSPTQLYHNVSPPIRPIQQQQQQIQRQRRKRDRFYDKSQDIPNAIYFGEVDVPLHVLHAYGGDSDSDNDRNKINSRPKQADTKFDPLKANTIRFSSQVSRGQGRIISKHSSLGQQNYETHGRPMTSSHSNNSKVRGRPKINSISPSNDRSIQMMKKFFKAAGLKRVKLNRLWEGCKSNSERATKMLELLREKGLEGEPTISKCKQLKLEYLTKKEIEDLDPNLIIQTEGRTRRSVTRAATKRIYTYDEEEILETRTKLRNVIDSDSDFE